MTISIQTEFSLSTDQDFIFTSIYSEAYAQLVDTNIQFMHLKNNSNQSIHINFKNCLEKITEMKEKHCYLINENSHNLAALKSVKLFSNCEFTEVKFKHKFYVLLVNKQTVVNETLNKMHAQSRLE